MAEYNTVKDRLIAFIAYLGIGQGKFEKKCELSNAYVANIRKSITPEKLQKIARHFPELNTGWLMTGEGEMLKSNTAGAEEKVVVDKKILDTIISQQETIRNQQRLLEKIIDAKFQSPAQTENPAGCAGAAGA